ncbi:Maf family protein [Gorillibacterium massiliense]|uniref:Maf family protein n=1 Tax=Gorillibacterium massiliense TaxID=1280390 RepID=UPI0004B16F9C|nr:Maf family protein [Gorillibacterium massiliense]
MTTTKTLVLASKSPRRQELIKLLDIPYEVVAIDTNEDISDSLAPDRMVEELSLRKAVAVQMALEDGKDKIVIGADTIVYLNGQVFGKPVDDDHAKRMLRELQGRPHQVYTGITCLDAESGEALTRHSVTDVVIKPLTDEQLDRYIRTGEGRDKAGSYAAQGIGSIIVQEIHGDFFNVVGLSISLLADMLEELGVSVM